MRIYILPFVLVATLILLSGCSVPITKMGMTPTTITQYASSGKTISVRPVVIRPQPKPGFLQDAPTMPDADTYRSAIVDTLGLTGLFTEVKTDGVADYSLSSEVIGQRMLGTMYNITLFLIRYELTDLNSNKVLWRENVFSHHELSAADVFMGMERTKQTVEVGTRKNMAQLGTKVGEVLSRQPK